MKINIDLINYSFLTQRFTMHSSRALKRLKEQMFGTYIFEKDTKENNKCLKNNKNINNKTLLSVTPY